MCEVVEISDDEDLPQFYASQASSTVAEGYSQELTSSGESSGALNHALLLEGTCPADRRRAEREIKRKEREAKKKEKEERKALKEQQRIEKKQEKAREKATAKAIKEVLKASDQEHRPGERVKSMIVGLDNGLLKRTEMMKKLLTEFHQLNIDHVVESSSVPNSVKWHRKLINRTVSDDATVISSTSHQEEQHLMVVMDAGRLAELVMNGRTHQHSGAMSSPDLLTCKQFVESIQNRAENKRVCLAIVGMETFERSLKTKHNREFRRAVLTQSLLQNTTAGGVDRIDLEEGLVELELSTGCGVRECSDDDKLVELIIQTTKAIAEAPFKRKNLFSFHDDLGPGPSKKDCTAENKLSMVWQHQLLQFPNTGPQTVAAIAQRYPTPCDLIKAYQACDSEATAGLLLQDIMVVRSSSRRLGPVLSKKIYCLLTSVDGATTLDN